MHCAFINSAGHSGARIVQRCLTLLGIEQRPVALSAWASPPSGWAFDQSDFDPDAHILIGADQPAYVPFNAVREKLAGAAGSGASLTGQLLWTPAAEALLWSFSMRMILVVRDPRDQVYARATATMLGRPETRLHALLERGVLGDDHCLPIDERYRRIRGWGDLALIVSFESLRGTSAGGSDAALRRTIQRIASHIGLDCGPNRIDHAVANLWRDGDRMTSWTEAAEFFSRQDIMAVCDRAANWAGYRRQSAWLMQVPTPMSTAQKPQNRARPAKVPQRRN
jgi:hypothetical protein